jgi:hypothetical protein
LLGGPSAVVIDNEIIDSGGNAVFLANGADSSSVIGNLLVRASVGVQVASGTTDVDVYYNTIVSMAGNCITVGAATQIDIRNNVLSYCTNNGIASPQANITLSNNLYFQNGGNCSPCSPGAGAKIDEDPLFTNFASGNFFPLLGSPAIDAALDIGVDRNGAGANNGYGGSPDIGRYETNY